MSVYFIQTGEGGPIKIGYTDDVWLRLSQLQCSHSETLYIRAVIDGGERIEHEKHAQFAFDHIRGEWFRPSDKLLSFIEKHEYNGANHIPAKQPYMSASRVFIQAGGNVVSIHTINSYETMNQVINKLEKGHEIVLQKLSQLAPNQKKLREVLSDIFAREAVIIEVTTGRRSDNATDAAEMVFDAIGELTQDRRTLTHEQAVTFGSEGGKKAAEKRLQDRMSEKEAKAIWRDTVTYETNAEALANMPGWEMRTAYARLGKSGRSAGRPRDTK